MTAGRARSNSSIGGMTCASCANRIERKLNKLDGVTATVNYATEKAKVTFADGVDPQRSDRRGGEGRLHRRAARPQPEQRGRRDEDEPDDESGALRQRLIISAVLAVPVIAMAMVPALQFTNWQWLSLTLAAPVVVCGGLAVPPGRLDEPAPRRRHDGHARLARHRSPRSAGRCTPCSSARAGTPGMTHPFEFTIERTDGVGQHLPRGRRRGDHVHPGRPLLRGPRPSAAPAPRCGPCWSWAPRTSPSCATACRAADADRSAGRRRPIRGPARREDRHRRRGRRGLLRGRRLDAHRRVGAGRGAARRRGRRRDRQRRRPPGRPRHPRRRRHPARPDGQAGRGRPDRQGAGPAARRPRSPGSSCRS